MSQIFDGLVETLPGSPQIEPGLAESWTVSADGLTYTFHLRHARFSNGAPVTSADAAFSISRLLSPKGDPNFATIFSFIKSTHTPDPSTLVVRLKKRTPAFLAYLTFPIPSIIPEAYFTKVGETYFAQHPIGTGPFALVSWAKNQQMTLKRNPYYWRSGEPHFAKLVFETVPNDNTRILDLESGTADIATGLPYGQIAALRQQTAVRLLIRQVTASDPVFLNEHRPPLQEEAVRQALNYATPKSDIQRIVFGGVAPVQNDAIGINKYWNPAVKPYPYDLQKASQVLATSTVPHGFSLSLMIDGSDQASAEMAQILQQAWKHIGVDVTIHEVDYGTLFTKLTGGNYQAAMVLPTDSSSDVPTDDELAAGFLTPAGGENSIFTYYNNPIVTKLVPQALTTATEPARRRLFGEIQQAAMTDPIFVYTVFSPAVAGVRSDIGGFGFETVDDFRLNDVYRAGQ